MVKEESKKAGLKLNIQKTKIMASSPITSWQIDGETMETVYFLQNHYGSKFTVDVNCNHEIKRLLFLRRKSMTNLDSVLKSRGTTLPTKVCIVKAMVFPVVMYGCESQNTKKAEHWRTDAFELWYWRRLLRVPWRARKSNQSILKEINAEYSLEGLMLNLNLQYLGHLMRKNWFIGKALMLGKTEEKRKGQQKMGWLDSITDSMDMSFSRLWEMMKDREAWHSAVHGVTKGRTQLRDWTTTCKIKPHIQDYIYM